MTKVRLTKVVAAVEKYKAEQGVYPGILEYLQTKPETPTAKALSRGRLFHGRPEGRLGDGKFVLPSSPERAPTTT